MPTIISILYARDQMRSIAVVSVRAARRGRGNVSHLDSTMLEAARFRFSDLFRLAIVNELVCSFGVLTGTVNAGFDALFRRPADACAQMLDVGFALITPTSASLKESDDWGTGAVPGKPTLAIPRNPLITRLKRHMLPVLPVPNQAASSFPSEAVRSRT